VFAGCALAGHSLLKPELHRWQLSSEQQDFTHHFLLQKKTNQTQFYRLVVSIDPYHTTLKPPLANEEQVFFIEAFCENNDELLKRHRFSATTTTERENVTLRLPDSVEQCFEPNGTAPIKIHLSLNTQKTTPHNTPTQGELYIE